METEITESQLQKHMGLLIELADNDIDWIDSEQLKDGEEVSAFFRTISNNIIMQANFIYKIRLDDLIRLVHDDVIHEEALSYLFQNTIFPMERMVDIIRNLPFDSRYTVMLELRENQYTHYRQLAQRIDSRYGMIDGILIEDVSQQSVMPNLDMLVLDEIDKDDSSMDAIKQHLFALSRESERLQSVIATILNEHAALFSNPNEGVKSKSEFAKIIKIAYAMALDPRLYDRYTKELGILEQRLLLNLVNQKEAKGLVQLLEQMPYRVLINILRRFSAAAKNQTGRQQEVAEHIIEMVEAMIQKNLAPKCKKCVRKGKLKYNIHKE
ncbi:MAG: hypothetical protein O3A01_03045 [bacterium]|nr:hypothetical protein [bacterium]